MGKPDWAVTSTEEIGEQNADRLALAECLEGVQARLEGAISMCYGLSDDAAMSANFAGRIQGAYEILRSMEKSLRSLGLTRDRGEPLNDEELL